MPFRRVSTATNALSASASGAGTPELRPASSAASAGAGGGEGPGAGSKDSLAELWSDFLEREALEGADVGVKARVPTGSPQVQRSRERVASPGAEGQ